MTLLRYTLQDAERWAQFSGDWNPVHFSLSRAREQGATRLSVHGMRALLDVKAALKTENAAPWLRCDVRLRQPLWCDEDYRLVSAPHKKQTLHVTGKEDEAVRLSCRLSGQEAEPECASGAISLPDRAEREALRQAFLALEPAARQWHFLDALMFRQLIREQSVMAQPEIAEVLPEPLTLTELFDRYLVLQTHQEVAFDARLQAPLASQQAMPTPEFSLLPALVAGSRQAGLVVQVGIAASVAEQRITNRLTLKIALRHPQKGE